MNDSDSSITGAKRSRDDETQETGRNHKSGEDRQPLATTDSRQESGIDAPGTNKAPLKQHTPSIIVETARTPDITTSPPGVSASTAEGLREVKVEELVTVLPTGAHAPSTRSSTSSSVETKPRNTLTFTGSKVQRVGDGEVRSPAASRHEENSLVRENNGEQGGQWSPVRVKKCQVWSLVVM